MKDFIKKTWNQPMVKVLHLAFLPLFIIIWTGYQYFDEGVLSVGPTIFALGILVLFWSASYFLRNNP